MIRRTGTRYLAQPNSLYTNVYIETPLAGHEFPLSEELIEFSY